MQINYGINAGAKKAGRIQQVCWDSEKAVNGHTLLVGMSGSGKTYRLRKMIESLLETSQDAPPRIHVFDVHGDIDIPGCSEVMFSEQTQHGINPLRINPDPHFGGVRKRVQGFISTHNKVSRALGGKQEAALRNLLLDVYKSHGFDQDAPATWQVSERDERLLSDGSDGRLYIDVPLGEKDEAKALGAWWEPEVKCWYVPINQYQGQITRWPPKKLGRVNPSISDVLRYARHVLQKSFFGTGMEAVVALGKVNKAARFYQKKLLESLKNGDHYVDEKLESAINKAKDKAIDAYQSYAEAIVTGYELNDIMKYDSTDVLKSVVDRLENLDAIGIFKPKAPPFEEGNPVWRYNIRALSMEERKLFVLFKLEEIFYEAVQRGEQDQIRDVIILDEGHIYADDDPENIINNIAKEARKFGIALICASQSPHHFTEDFISSVGTKIILGIDEMYWRSAVSKMRVQDDALKWIRPQKTMLVQVKTKGETKNDWQWTIQE